MNCGYNLKKLQKKYSNFICKTNQSESTKYS